MMRSELTASMRLTVDEPAPAHAAARLTVVCECRRPMAPALRIALADVQQLRIVHAERRSLERSGAQAVLGVPDPWLSAAPLVVRRAGVEWHVEVIGPAHRLLVNGVPTGGTLLVDGDVIEAGGTLLVFGAGADADPVGDLDLARAGADALPAAFRTASPTLERAFHQLARIASSDAPVLLRGETGTGKELVARALHEGSGRRGPFVPIECGALHGDLIASELFGHRRGAFAGADEDREGLVRRAGGGTLFLDEVGDLDDTAQATLLRVLQERAVRPLGSTEAVEVDLRVIATTHQDLAERIASGRFRRDLYARLAGFELTLPALRDRREDLGTLIASIVPRLTTHGERITLEPTAARAMLRYRWPCNIRELEQALRVAVALSDTGELRLEHLPSAIRAAVPTAPRMSAADRVLRERLTGILVEHAGNVAAAGRAMNKAPIQIRRWCLRLGIDLARFRHLR